MSGRNVYCSRAAVRHLLSTNKAPANLLRQRLAAVEKLRDNVVVVVRWPALAESLEQDAREIRKALKTS